ncbi:LysR family transcriptional regulator [Chitinasiproducens palmae]|uniref:DNA-binding transcriptional regulator, LysR family n=1 Tax=Chitinasiproducens palmae TaxID=1770053 RepID=A0A1H2PNC8_9BURK|nr:LysR family transcriptional regulator [Chitinasiproducens palmae]SDV48152.1 DNA-binding transcriptional regulator, LysR family [Chitinasiproducens palmae]
METKWLEDFVSLAETHSFSRSAALRHITQPAFSRRIQALESWVGAELIDRSVFPTRLTEAGEIFHAQALTILSQAREARLLLRSKAGASESTIEFAVPHTLSLTFMPHWLHAIERAIGEQPLHARLRALNVHDAAIALVEGGCDLMMAYHHPSQPIALDPARYESIVLGTEALRPYVASDASGSALLALDGDASTPYLAYSANAYLGRMTEYVIARAVPPLTLHKIYETDMAEGLKEMALAGHGIAFLPDSAAAQAVDRGRLLPLGRPALSVTMDIRLYRDKLGAERDGPHADGQRRDALIERVWQAACAQVADAARKPAD